MAKTCMRHAMYSRKTISSCAIVKWKISFICSFVQIWLILCSDQNKTRWMNLKVRAFHLSLVFYSGQSYFKTSGRNQTSEGLRDSPPQVDKMVGISFKQPGEINTMFPLYRIGFYNVKTIRYNGNRIWHITLHNITCFH